MKELIEKARTVQSKTDAYLLLIEIVELLSELRKKKALLELEMQKIKASILAKDMKLSSEKLELSAVENPTYSKHFTEVSKLEADIKSLEKLYDTVMRFYNEQI